jgi:sulfite reductase alpha subunit-like flavoprotein
MIMDKNPEAVWDVLSDPDACAYYCGPAMGIPKLCSDAMTRAMMSAGKMSETEAADYFKLMCNEERWRVECF